MIDARAMRDRRNEGTRAGTILRSSLAATALGCAASVAGASGTNVRSLIEAPLAVRGGVVMLPLAGGPEARIPDRVELVLADGRRIYGMTAWIEAGPFREPAESLAAHWTSDPMQPRVSTTRAAAGAQPILLARLPEDSSGEILLSDQLLRPTWVDRAGPLQANTLAAPLAALAAPDRPDLRSPLEHWRWVLLADRLHAAPPSLDRFSETEALVAQHSADLWRFALGRLAQHNLPLALDVRDRLTRICTDATGDRRTDFAAWVTDRGETNRLLSVLADVRIRPADAAAEAQTWIDIQASNGPGGGLLTWIESATDERIRLVVVNTAHRAVVARFSWEGRGLTDEPPIAVELQPGRLMRVILDHPQAARRFEPALPTHRAHIPLHLRIVSDAGTYDIPFGTLARGVAVVRAPGLMLPPLRPPLTLSEVTGGPPPLTAPEHTAAAQLRKLRGRWELFFEVMRPKGGEASASASPTTIAVMIGPEEVDGGPDVHLVVPEHGWHELLRGTNDGTLQVHRRSFDDRWYCRVVLPEAWLNTLPGEANLISVMRTQAGEPASQYSPFAPAPWRPTSSRMAVDLSEWDDLPE
jgi:hypothetical protein